MAHELKSEDLGQFTGTENWYRHAINRNLTYTDGVRFVAEHGGAYWLIDEIALAQSRKEVRAEEFQHWTLTVTNHTAVLSCGDGNGNTVYSQQISFTDFPLPTINFYFCGGVLMLPNEY